MVSHRHKGGWGPIKVYRSHLLVSLVPRIRVLPRLVVGDAIVSETVQLKMEQSTLNKFGRRLPTEDVKSSISLGFFSLFLLSIKLGLPLSKSGG